MGLRPYRFACEGCNRQVDELHFTYVNRQPRHFCHDCLRAFIAHSVSQVAARARAAGRLGGEVSAAEEDYPAGEWTANLAQEAADSGRGS